MAGPTLRIPWAAKCSELKSKVFDWLGRKMAKSRSRICLAPKHSHSENKIDTYCWEHYHFSRLGNIEDFFFNCQNATVSLSSCFCFTWCLFLSHLSTFAIRTQGDLSLLNYPNKTHRKLMPKKPLVHSTTFADVRNNPS